MLVFPQEEQHARLPVMVGGYLIVKTQNL